MRNYNKTTSNLYLVSTTNDPEINKLKMCLELQWKNDGIKWEQIFDLISFYPYVLHDNFINYWSTDHLLGIKQILYILHEKPESILGNITDIENTKDARIKQDIIDDLETAQKLKPHIYKLMTLFDFYIQHNCVILVSSKP